MCAFWSTIYDDAQEQARKSVRDLHLEYDCATKGRVMKQAYMTQTRRKWEPKADVWTPHTHYISLLLSQFHYEVIFTLICFLDPSILDFNLITIVKKIITLR